MFHEPRSSLQTSGIITRPKPNDKRAAWFEIRPARKPAIYLSKRRSVRSQTGFSKPNGRMDAPATLCCSDNPVSPTTLPNVIEFVIVVEIVLRAVFVLP
jgi:hypothetical protein